MIDPTDTVFGSTQEQHPLSHGRLPGINVRNDADVSEVFYFPSHD